MNIFVLCTGRCGSVTFSKACSHITNFSSAHESRVGYFSKERLAYQDNHIEIDNRLSWFIGELDEKYGNKAFYVHLIRNRQDTANSFIKRYDIGIIKAYRSTITLNFGNSFSPIEITSSYYDTVNANITLFLKDKTNKMIFKLENYTADFLIFWDRIKATGNKDKALKEFLTRYNSE
jgi:hypothetical protein